MKRTETNTMSATYDMRVINSLTDLCIACSWFAFHTISSLISHVTLQEYNAPADKLNSPSQFVKELGVG